MTVSAGELPCERGVSEEQEAGHKDAGLRHRDVRRVLAPHPGQWSHRNDWKDIPIFYPNIWISYFQWDYIYFENLHRAVSLSDNFQLIQRFADFGFQE